MRPYRSTLGLLVAVTLTASLIRAGETPEVSIDELRVPSSPAFTLLGVSPTAVERPSTPRALGLSLLSATERSNSKVPNDVAIEFAPYWWKSHPGLTFEDYYSNHKGIGATIAQTLAISLGTTALEDQVGSKGTRAALGLRFMLRQGGMDPKLAPRVSALKQSQIELLECVPDEPTEPIDQGCLAVAETKMRAAQASVTEKAERLGWTVEYAVAATRDFPDDDANAGRNTRLGTWITAAYHRNGPLSVVGVARYVSEDGELKRTSTTDIGSRLIWKGESEGGMPPIAISLEYARRFADESEDSSRLVAIVEYRLPIENLSLVASYGQDFMGLTGRESLISTLGISVGFGKGPIVKASQ